MNYQFCTDCGGALTSPSPGRIGCRACDWSDIWVGVRTAVLGDLYPADSDGCLYWPPETNCRRTIWGDINCDYSLWGVPDDVLEQSLFEAMTVGSGFIKAVATGDGVSLFNVSHPWKEPSRKLFEELARVERAAEPVYCACGYQCPHDKEETRGYGEDAPYVEKYEHLRWRWP